MPPSHFRWEASVSLDVRDDGVGFNPADPPRTGRASRGKGHAGIRDRVARHNGQLVVDRIIRL